MTDHDEQADRREDTSDGPASPVQGRPANLPARGDGGVPVVQQPGGGQPPRGRVLDAWRVPDDDAPGHGNPGGSRRVVIVLSAFIVVLVIALVIAVVRPWAESAPKALPAASSSPVTATATPSATPSPSQSSEPPGGEPSTTPGATPSAGASSTSTSVIPGGGVVHYLDEDDPSQMGSCVAWHKGTYPVGDAVLEHSIEINSGQCAGGNPYIEYALQPTRSCSKFTATLGMPNTERDVAQVSMEVDVDGKAVVQGLSLHRQQSKAVTADVRPGSILRIVATDTTPHETTSGINAVVGNAQLNCAS